MTKTVRIPLSEALRLHWKYLIPIMLLPTFILSFVGLIQQVWVFWVTVPFFYGCGFCAMYPCLRKGAPYSFWIAACGVWMIGAIPGILVLGILKGIFHR